MIREAVTAFGLMFGESPMLETPPNLDFEHDKNQITCLADNMYWEARNQSVKGMLAVGYVTMNRVSDDRFPYSVCEVVEQGPVRESWKTKGAYYPVKNRCQFSWYCDGKSDEIPSGDEDLYSLITAMAFKIFYADEGNDITDGATHYHAYYVSPEWASTKTQTVTIGDHIFYRWEIQ